MTILALIILFILTFVWLCATRFYVTQVQNGGVKAFLVFKMLFRRPFSFGLAFYHIMDVVLSIFMMVLVYLILRKTLG